jgi:hypothetical protein
VLTPASPWWSGRQRWPVQCASRSSGAGVSSGWTRTPACLSEAAARRSIGRIRARRSVALERNSEPAATAFHGCRSEAGADRAAADVRSLSCAMPPVRERGRPQQPSEKKERGSPKFAADDRARGQRESGSAESDRVLDVCLCGNACRVSGSTTRGASDATRRVGFQCGSGEPTVASQV